MFGYKTYILVDLYMRKEERTQDVNSTISYEDESDISTENLVSTFKLKKKIIAKSLVF